MIKVNNDFKKTLIRQRSGDENIGRLIVFAVIILTAVGVIGLLGYFYKFYTQKTTITSVLENPYCEPHQLKAIKLCEEVTSEGGVKYNGHRNEYAISCGKDDVWKKDFKSFVKKFPKIREISDNGWAEFPGIAGDENNVVYYEIDQ